MSSLLCICADPDVATSIEAIANEYDVRVRIVASRDSAEEWLAMQQFDTLLMDTSGHTTKEILQTLTLGWSHNPIMNAGVLSLSKPFKNSFDVILIGGQVYEDTESVREFLSAQPSAVTLGESSYYGILVVEDLDSPRDIICAYIEALGYPVVKGVDGVDTAIQELEAKPYEYFCIVSDLKMPKKSGLDLIEYVRAHSLLKPLPIVVLTSSPSKDNLATCISAGASGFLAKPPKKLHLQKELERAKRILRAKASPRLCEPEQAKEVEELLLRSRHIT